MKREFRCGFCGVNVITEGFIGTHHRNHCPNCLWSKHLGQNTENNKIRCGEPMKPIGLTFKHEGLDKYGNKRQGELMIIHRCSKDQEITINRLASDDNTETIMSVFTRSIDLNHQIKEELAKQGIRLLDKSDEQEITNQLFGKQ